MSDADAEHPPESPGHPARLDIEYPEEGLGRASTVFRILLAVPILVVQGLLTRSFADPEEAAWAWLLAVIALFGPTLLVIVFRQKHVVAEGGAPGGI